jgi:hypothetical protein
LYALIDLGHVRLVDRNDAALVIVDERRQLSARILRRLRDMDGDSSKAEPIGSIGVGENDELIQR